jgi:hypothetical protein
VLLEETDPALVTMEIDLFWMIAGGADPVAILASHSGRFALMILAQADRYGVQHFFLERDLASDPVQTLRASYRALAAIDLGA